MQILDQLEKLTKGPVVIPVDQLLATSAQAAPRSPEMEKAARSMGFKNAEEWIMFERAKQRKTGGTIAVKGASTTGAAKNSTQASTRPKNPAAGGVSSILNRVSDALKRK